MMSGHALAVAAALSVVALDARAQNQPTGEAPRATRGAKYGRIFAGVRSGYALPFGAISGGWALGEVFDAQVPISIDLGYRVTKNLLVAGYGAYGFGIPRRASSADTRGCPRGMDCSLHLMRFGLEAEFWIRPDQAINPWIGLGLGYEVMSVAMSGTLLGQKVGVTDTLSGFEFARLEAGTDFAATRGVGVGPFVSLAFGRYLGCATETEGQSGRCTLDAERYHEWLTLGLRGAFWL
jgi:hypothetical protein